MGNIDDIIKFNDELDSQEETAKVKNWSGNRNSIFKTLGASNHTKEDREVNDYYATDPIACKFLMELE